MQDGELRFLNREILETGGLASESTKNVEISGYSRLVDIVSSVWVNPLVDDELLKFRQAALTNLNSKMSSFKESHPDLEWAGMLCGSAIGGISEGSETDQFGRQHSSDFDYILYVNDMDLVKEFKNNPALLGENTDIVTVGYWQPQEVGQDELPTKIGKVNADLLDTGFEDFGYADSLLTPDDFVCGNKEIVKQIRLAASRQMTSRRARFPLMYEDKFREKFKDHYAYFASTKRHDSIYKTSDGSTQIVNMTQPNNKNRLRFIKGLLKKVSQFASISNIEGVSLNLLIKLGALPRGNSTIRPLVGELPVGEAIVEGLVQNKGKMPLNESATSLLYNPLNNGFPDHNPSKYSTKAS